MRKILFRGKCTTTDNWVEGYFHLGSFSQASIITEYYGEFPVMPATVSEFTGLCDKNGKRIFEDDLIDIPGSKKQGLPAVVTYRENEGMFVLSRKGYSDMNLIGIETWGVVVGNIHDNPELWGAK